jgi:hypothetical protein
MSKPDPEKVIQFTEQEFYDMLQGELMQAAAVGIETGLQTATDAFLDALERAEFVELRTCMNRVKTEIARAFDGTNFDVSLETPSEEEDDDGNS